MAYRDQLREMNDADLEREWRNRCDAKLRYGACQAMYDDCWFESTNRGMGQAFLDVFIQMKEEWKVEQLDQIARIRALGGGEVSEKTTCHDNTKNKFRRFNLDEFIDGNQHLPIDEQMQLLAAKKQEILEENLAIKGQLDKAKAVKIETGEYADADWYFRANYAKRKLGALLMKIQVTQTALKQKRHQEQKGKESIRKKEFRDFFFDAAQDYLPGVEFRRLCDLAEERKNLSQEEPQ